MTEQKKNQITLEVGIYNSFPKRTVNKKRMYVRVAKQIMCTLVNTSLCKNVTASVYQSLYEDI